MKWGGFPEPSVWLVVRVRTRVMFWFWIRYFQVFVRPLRLALWNDSQEWLFRKNLSKISLISLLRFPNCVIHLSACTIRFKLLQALLVCCVSCFLCKMCNKILEWQKRYTDMRWNEDMRSEKNRKCVRTCVNVVVSAKYWLITSKFGDCKLRIL